MRRHARIQDGKILTPPRFQPHEIGPDYVLGRFQDEMDINYVRLYSLNKPEGAPPAPGLRPWVGSGDPDEDQEVGPRVPDEVAARVCDLPVGREFSS